MGREGWEASPSRSQAASSTSGDKLLTDLVRQYPKEVTVICMGPLTTLAGPWTVIRNGRPW